MKHPRGKRRQSWLTPNLVLAERMEQRRLLSFTPYVSDGWVATPNYQFLNAVNGSLGTAAPLGSTSPAGAPLTPATMRSAYGLGSFTFNAATSTYTYNYGISFNGVKGDGTGQTIAIVDVGSDPDIATDLQTFDAYYDLPNPPSFQQLSQTGSSTSLPGVASGWPGEISLDVEWSHVMAPGANIILFAASDLYAAVQYAASYPGVSVVSMSFTISGNAPDSDFTTPSGHTGVSFFAGAGDTGSEVPSPAQSVNVVAVGGTTLNLNSSGGYSSESAWSAGGGGISTSESQPAFQNGIVSSYSTTQRTTPDVAMDGDPGSGVAIVDSYDSGSSAPWELIIGGTSLSTPLFAGVVAVADQGRVSEGLTPLDGGSQTLPRLYELSQANYSSNFHDITTGNNGHAASAGYDLTTGLGSVVGNNLIPDLAGGDTLSGQAFIDTNGNGVYDAGTDTLLANKTVYLDLNNGGAQEAIDPTATTNSSGGYIFTDVIGSFSGVVRLAGTSGYLQENTGTVKTAYDASQTYNLALVSNTLYTATVSPAATTLKSTLGVTISGTAASGLTYTWLAANEPEGAAPSFSPNGTAAAQNSTVTFNKAGTYILAVKITNASGQVATSSVTVTVTQVLTSIAVVPVVPGVGGGQTAQLAVTAYDQFGALMSSTPSVTWSVTSGSASVTPAGVFTAPVAGGIVAVRATTGSISATGTVDCVAVPWTPQDIGTLGNNGYAYDSGGTTTLSEASDDIWNTSDDFLFDSQELAGNVTITAELNSQTSSSGYIKAGLMIRNSLSSSDQMAMVCDPAPGPLFEWRTTSGASAAQDATSKANNAPYWLQLVRNGSTFTAYSSPNDVNWTLIGTQTIAMGTDVYVGLALSSHDASLNATAVFSHVTVVSGQVLTSIQLVSTPVNLSTNQSQQLLAVGYDQNGFAMSTQPSFNYTLTSGIGTLSSMGYYTAPATGTLATFNVSNGTLAASGTIGVVVSPWTSTDIGVLGIAGIAYDSATTTTISDASDDIWNQSDDFHFDYQTLAGNGTITAELNSETSASDYIKAGLMMRNSLASTDAMAMVCDPAPGPLFEWRTASDAVAAQDATSASNNTPYWLRLVRNGNLFSGYASPNGITWTFIGSQTIVMNSTLFVGLALTSHNPSDLATAVFSNVSISNPTVATAAAVSPSPVTGKTAALSVLGANTPNSAGESSLTYTWSATSIPAGATLPTFSVNGTNAAKAATVTFFNAGTYTFRVSIADSLGDSVTSSVTVTVSQTLTTISVTPTSATVFDAQTSQFSATAKDQFGAAMVTQPGFSWGLASGGFGSISTTGLYSSPPAGAGSATVQATSGTVVGTAAVTVNLSVIDGTSGDDTIRLVRSGSNLLVYINNPTTPVYTVSYASLVGLTVLPGTGNDSINLDFSGAATPVPSGGVSITGGGGNDSVIVTGTAGNDTATVTASSITFNGSVITYTAVDSILVDGNGGTDALTQSAQPGNAATLAFNGSTSGGPSASDTLNVNAGSYTFPTPNAGGGVQPLSLASLSIANGASVSLPTATAHGDRWVLTTSALTLSATSASLDLGANDLIVHNANATTGNAALAAVNGEIAVGANGGLWNGLSGISSSAIAASGSHLLALGVMIDGGAYNSFDNQAVGTNDVLVKFTYLGDANLDGQVDGSDYTRIDYGFAAAKTGWSYGDFNYDGTVDGSDYTLIDNAFNTQGATLAAQIAPTATASIGSSASLKSASVVLGETKKPSFTPPVYSSQPSTSSFASTGQSEELLQWEKDRLDDLSESIVH